MLWLNTNTLRKCPKCQLSPSPESTMLPQAMRSVMHGRMTVTADLYEQLCYKEVKQTPTCTVKVTTCMLSGGENFVTGRKLTTTLLETANRRRTIPQNSYNCLYPAMVKSILKFLYPHRDSDHQNLLIYCNSHIAHLQRISSTFDTNFQFILDKRQKHIYSSWRR